VRATDGERSGTAATGGGAWAACPGCGVALPGASVSSDTRRNASDACWQMYGEVTGRELQDLVALGRYHQLTVDTYGAQHAGAATPAIGTAFSLIGLHLALDEGLDGPDVREIHRRLAADRVAWPRFDPPTTSWAVTVYDVALAGSSEEHAALVARWAASVWEGWRGAHRPVARLIAERLPEAVR
jgi:hypothetical protein